MARKKGPSARSLAVQALGWTDPRTREVVLPIHTATTYIRDPDNRYRSGLVYARADNPTYLQVEALMALGMSCCTT